MAKAVISSDPQSKYDPAMYESNLCEWDILGQSGQEVYVFAICVPADENGNTNRPAIIYLEADGSIQSVKVAEYEGSFYDLGLFPANVQRNLCFYSLVSSQCPDATYYPNYPRPRVDALYARLEYRKIHPEEPPLVVLLAISVSP